MQTWKRAFEDGIKSGSVAAVISTLALIACGYVEHKRPAAPNNGPSQWLWGRQAAYRQRMSLRHTVVGYLVHHSMSVFWAVLHEKTFGHRRNRTAVDSIAPAIVTTATACYVDYHLTPRRLQPGFDKHLNTTSLCVVYGAFAVGLAALKLIERTRKPFGD